MRLKGRIGSGAVRGQGRALAFRPVVPRGMDAPLASTEEVVVTPEEVQALMDACDPDGDGICDYDVILPGGATYEEVPEDAVLDEYWVEEEDEYADALTPEEECCGGWKYAWRSAMFGLATTTWATRKACRIKGKLAITAPAAEAVIAACLYAIHMALLAELSAIYTYDKLLDCEQAYRESGQCKGEEWLVWHFGKRSGGFLA